MYLFLVIYPIIIIIEVITDLILFLVVSADSHLWCLIFFFILRFYYEFVFCWTNYINFLTPALRMLSTREDLFFSARCARTPEIWFVLNYGSMFATFKGMKKIVNPVPSLTWRQAICYVVDVALLSSNQKQDSLFCRLS